MSILDYFPKKDNTSSRKRKLEINDDENTNEPPKKKLRTNNSINNNEEKEEESLTPNNNNNNNNSENEEKEIITDSDLSYTNVHKLIEKGWKSQLKNEFTKPYFKQLLRNLEKEEKKGTEIFPPIKQVYRAFELCPWDKMKVVILGQDPYHDNGQAEGLCFSVPKGIKIPSSLRNMFKEAESDINGFKKPSHGSLVTWAKQGVLLLNTVLTVTAHKANSHKKYGWQEFTDSVIKTISNKHSGVVFILWGKQAQKKENIINSNKHFIIKSAHPSGLSASRGFYGSKPYSKTNNYLKKKGLSEIDWNIPL